MAGLAMALLTLLAAATPAMAAAAATPAKKKPAAKKTAPKPPAVSPEQRAAASTAVQAQMADAVDLGIQNAAAMVPFYEMLYRRQQGESGGPVRVLQFGDSHTASDDWAGELRARFQQKFGDGGPGFTQAGRPFAGFRRLDSKQGMSRGWKAEGLLAREGDGLYGLGGVSVTAQKAGEMITLEAEGEALEIYYFRQPGGGEFVVEDNEAELERISTDGEAGPGYFRRVLPAGMHRLAARTLDAAPVRLFGWVLEKGGGVTWEPLGINGAQADLLLLWDERLLKSHLERRNPALVVLAYGTNEARRSDWTYETYRSALSQVVQRIRQAAPAASILIIGAPDQGLRVRWRVTPFDGVDHILLAQKDAALENGCAFWNLRAAMGGKGSMKQWVQAGLAQGDYVHLTSPGYRLVGDSLYELIMGQYGIFQTVRRQVLGSTDNGPQAKTH
jgi:lysophospholipase L1-like esterase